jgi:hypothetical protein
MTNAILESDIELAKALIASHRPEHEIIAALVNRRIDPEKAAKVIADLRNGIKVQPELVAFPKYTLPRREPAPNAGEQQPRIRTRRAVTPRSPGDQREPSVALRFALVFVIFGGIGAGLFVIWSQRFHAKTDVLLDHLEIASTNYQAVLSEITDRKLNAIETSRLNAIISKHDHTPAPQPPKPTPKSGTGFVAPASSAPAQPGELVLELRPEGLFAGGQPLTKKDAMLTVSTLLGAPTRTNEVEVPDKVVYAYDHHGLLIYSRRGLGDDYVVLDFDATGGTNGTTSAFAGKVKVENSLIQANTKSCSLGAIKQLELADPGADVGILKGHCNGLGLYFAYLKTPQRLDLIEIDLK